MAPSKLNATLCPASLLCQARVPYLVSFGSRLSFGALQPWDALREKHGTASPCSCQLLARRDLPTAKDSEDFRQF